MECYRSSCYRPRKIVVRMALGATRQSVAQIVFRQGSIVIGIGVGVGLLLGFPAERLIQSFLYEVHRGSQRNPSLMSRVLDHQGVEQLGIRGAGYVVATIAFLRQIPLRAKRSRFAMPGCFVRLASAARVASYGTVCARSLV